MTGRKRRFFHRNPRPTYPQPTPGSFLILGAYEGFEAMRAIMKKQARAFQLQPGIRGEVRLVERAFGIGPDMMSELMSLHGAELERIAIRQGS